MKNIPGVIPHFEGVGRGSGEGKRREGDKGGSCLGRINAPCWNEISNESGCAKMNQDTIKKPKSVIFYIHIAKSRMMLSSPNLAQILILVML